MLPTLGADLMKGGGAKICDLRFSVRMLVLFAVANRLVNL